jgi:hypothetical protein
MKRGKGKEQAFDFIVVETVTYRLRAKGATVEKAAERAGEMFAQGPRRYFESVEDRAVQCEWPSPTPAASGALWGFAESSAAGMEWAGDGLEEN